MSPSSVAMSCSAVAAFPGGWLAGAKACQCSLIVVPVMLFDGAPFDWSKNHDFSQPNPHNHANLVIVKTELNWR